ncbi:MAG: D-alanyl-D-alanine carboxypeptidase/D-alanyl-D-alanine-endopeptidase [Phycisphaerae bacterium]|nr:D-alanyl-D-alanine carboxypeptidase/D-alanyl-D-alanine-endopeptidase [Phycisphaerae bacterium]
MARAGDIGTMAAWLLAACAVSSPVVEVRGQPLDREVESLVAQSKLGPVRVGICVVDTASGRVLAEHNARDSFMPASNMKLLTSGAAVLVLSPDFEFRTTLFMDNGRLVIKGAGDPALADPVLLEQMHMGVDGLVRALVDGVSAKGVREVREVIVDDRVFDRDYIHPSWPKEQLNQWYCAEVSGLNFHTNILSVFASPATRPGSTPSIRTEPSADWIELTNKSQTVSTGSTSIWLAREAAANRFTVFGSVRAALDKPVEVTMHEPALVFGRLVADRLGAAGFRNTDGTSPRARLADEKDEFPTAAQAETLAVVRTPLNVVLERCNVSSHNLYAESLIKRLGHEATGQPGSWANGAAVLRMQLNAKLGPDTDGGGSTVVADGSGLSRENRVTPLLLAQWLRAMHADKATKDALLESMPVAGEEGTLKKRFRGKKLGHEVRAKSGFINGVQCLSGYVVDHDTDRCVAFSVLINDITPKTPFGKAKELHESVVATIDKWLTRTSRSAAEPATSRNDSEGTASPDGKKPRTAASPARR